MPPLILVMSRTLLDRWKHWLDSQRTDRSIHDYLLLDCILLRGRSVLQECENTACLLLVINDTQTVIDHIVPLRVCAWTAHILGSDDTDASSKSPTTVWWLSRDQSWNRSYNHCRRLMTHVMFDTGITESVDGVFWGPLIDMILYGILERAKGCASDVRWLASKWWYGVVQKTMMISRRTLDGADGNQDVIK